MNKLFTRSLLAASIAALSVPAMSNGLAINEQSVSAAGTAYAGRSSNVLDASTIYGNPAGLSRLEGTQISGGGAFVSARTNINQASSPLSGPPLGFTGSNKGDMVPDSVVPFAYFSQKLSDKVAWGIGIYAPFALKSEYDKNFLGRTHGLEQEVTVTVIQPTLSYRFNDVVAIGIGPTFSRIEGKLTNRIPGEVFAAGAAAKGAPPAVVGALAGAPDAGVKIKGHDTATGYNLGVLLTPMPNLDWGITYHSKLSYNLEGHATVTGNPAPTPGGQFQNGRHDASLSITLPESVDTSFSYRIGRIGLYAGATWTRWSRLKTLEVNSDANLPTEEMNWEDTVAYAIGSSYDVSDMLTLRLGYANDPSPTSNADRTVRLPVGNRQVVTVGAGITPVDNVTIDLAYGYLWESSAQVNADTYSAKFKNRADIVGAQLTYRF